VRNLKSYCGQGCYNNGCAHYRDFLPAKPDREKVLAASGAVMITFRAAPSIDRRTWRGWPSQTHPNPNLLQCDSHHGDHPRRFLPNSILILP